MVTERKQLDVRTYNRAAWNREVERGNRWTVPGGRSNPEDRPLARAFSPARFQIRLEMRSTDSREASEPVSAVIAGAY